MAAQSSAVLEETGLGGFAELADAVRAAAGGHLRTVTNDSPVGMLLRKLSRAGYAVERHALYGSISASEQRVGLARAAAVRPLRVVLAEGGSLPALGEMLVYRQHWAAPGWREQVVDGLGRVQVPAERLRAAEQQRLEKASAPPWEQWPPVR